MHARTSAPDQVAIVGMAVLLPGADSLDSYWDNLVNGTDAITEVPAHRWDAEFYQPTAAADRPDRVYCRNGGFVDQYADFEALRFGIMPNSIPDTEPDQLIALRVAAAAIDDAGGPQWLPSADRVGVVLGRGGYLTPGQVRLNQRVRVANQLVHVLRELVPEVAPERLEQVRRRFSERLGPHQPEAAIGLVPNLAASRLANRLDLRGPAYTVDAACASSLLAVDQAVAELASGRCDVMLAGGVHHCHDIVLWSVFSQLKALSRRGQSRPFDRGADGLLIGEGTGVVVLKRLLDAVRDDDRIYAVIRGTGVSSDGRTASLFNPEPAGQAVAIRRAWEMAGLDPAAADSLGLLEAHGTATPTGDLAELTTVAEVFGPAVAGPQPVIGSVKSMIGHAMPAAGVAGLVKAALAVHHGMLLPTLHCEDPRPELTRTRFAPLAAARPWDLPGPRRAAVNAFGFGGINAHVLLEQAPGGNDRPGRSPVRPIVTVAQPDEMLWLAAADGAAMTELLAADDAALRRANLAGATPATEPVGGSGCRLGVPDPTDARLAVARRIAERRKPWRGGRDIWFSTEALLPAGGVAFVFPGLESKFAPRLDDVAAHFGWSGPAWSGADVGRLSAAGFEVSRMLCSVLGQLDVTPDAMAGHSVGEWTAMAAAGMFTPAAVDQLLETFDPDNLQVPGVVFAAVGAAAARVHSLLADSAGEFPEVVLSHDNAPAQSVVCGPEEQVLALVRRLRSRNILSDVLPFRSGFHTPAFEPFLGPVRAAHLLFDLHPPRVPVWSATTAAPFPDDPQRVRELFLRHLVEPVLFRGMVEAMHDAGTRVFLQVGVGQLASVIEEVLRGRDHLAVPVNVAHRSGLDQLRRVATALWVEGATVDLSVLTPRITHAETRRRADSGTVRLDLGGALVQLGGAAAGLLGRAPGAAAAADPADSSLLDQLHDLTRRSAVTADLAALLRDTAQTAVTVFNAVAPGGPRPQVDESPQTHRSVLQISTDAMPFLLDHCFFPQHEDWPHTEDRWPVVPATTITRLMLRAVERATPGIMVLGVRDARFDRWVIAMPPVEVEMHVKPSGPGEFAVGFGRYARASVHVGTAYPPAPEPLRPDPGSEQPPQITAEQLYTERWLFHGPQFQGITRLLALGEWHVRALLTAPTAPGSLLDNVGQLVGYWIQSTQSHRTMVFPVGAESIDFFGPRPAAGEPVECVLRILELTEAEVRADAQLIVGDRVWARFTGWVERRFDSHPHHRQAERFPQRYAFSYAQPEGWTAVFDRWPDAASRELLSRTMLGNADRAEYERQPPRTRRHWLLGRIAAKDAVRIRLWADGTEEIYPAELRVDTDTTGRPTVGGWAGRDVGEFDVSLAQCAEVGVAIARAGTPGAGDAGVGIDVREVADSTDDFPLSADERRLLSSVTGTPELSPTWVTRCRAAKEAVARSAGAGPSTIIAATDRELTVDVAGRSYQVRHRELDNPDDLPPRRYVVAWTWGLEPNDSQLTTFGDGR